VLPGIAYMPKKLQFLAVPCCLVVQFGYIVKEMTSALGVPRQRDGIMDLRNLPIAVVAIETGLSKDLLRKWEARYGFPCPQRSVSGIREYPLAQVRALREIKHKIDDGRRAGEAICAVLAKASSKDLSPEASSPSTEDVAVCLQAIRSHDACLLNARFEHSLASLGGQKFIVETVAPLIVAVGESWLGGRLHIHEEHFFTDRLSLFLSGMHRQLPVAEEAPVFLITSPPGERHTLGMEMVRVLVAEAGYNCISLGAQTPLAEMAAAVEAHQARLLMLSFSAAFAPRLLNQTLNELRMLLPEPFPVWIGGAGGLGVSRLPAGIRRFVDIKDVASALAQWRHEYSCTSS
jgi:DNA-binding transcriptional MerR regulator/methylmalonyl-CoA mutase cobalamin-binding subunit